MDDQLEFHWNDIHQLDKMFSMASAETAGTGSVAAAGATGVGTEHGDAEAESSHDDNASNSTPDSGDTKHAKAATASSTTSNAHTNPHTNASLTDSTTPSSANNDYMLFLNLTTPNSVVDDPEGGLVRGKEKEQAKDGKREADEVDDGRESDSANAAAFAKFSFDAMQSSHLDFIIDQQHQQQQQQPTLNQLSYSAVPNPQPPSTQSRSRINSVEFTPLLSPMINPSLERVNSNKGKSGFSPLSSPVLEFQKYNSTTSLRQKRKDPHDAHTPSVSSNTAGNGNGNDSYQDQQQNDTPNGKNIKFENSDARSYKRSKTPVSTPLLSTLDRKSKISSNRNSSSTGSSTQTTPYQTYVFKQQQFPSNKDASGSTRSSINISNSMDYPNNSFLDAFDGDLTLPPPPTTTVTTTGKGSISENDGFAIPSTAYISNTGHDGHDLTMALNSATNMFNTSSNPSSKKNSVLLNPNHHRSAQSSPVILPSSSIPLGSPRLDPKSINTRSSHASSVSSAFRPSITASKFASSSSSSVNTLSNMSNTNVSAVGTNILGTPQIGSIPPNAISISEDDGIEARSGSISGTDGNPDHMHHHHHHHHTDKKMSHKLAEQGRRNRMNIAIQDLDKMIPESMKRNITVPSKATTVELGCRYIQELLDQLQNNHRVSDDDSYVRTDKLIKSESISPLDALENANNSHNSNHNNNTDNSGIANDLSNDSV